MTRTALFLTVTLSISGAWAVSARAEEPLSGNEGVTRPAPVGKEGVTRPGKADGHDHEREGPKSSAPT